MIFLTGTSFFVLVTIGFFLIIFLTNATLTIFLTDLVLFFCFFKDFFSGCFFFKGTAFFALLFSVFLDFFGFFDDFF